MIKLGIGSTLIKVENFIFSGGEVQVKLPDLKLRGNEIYVWAYIHSSNDIMELLLVNDALTHVIDFSDEIRKKLVIPYLPYARQDRVMNKGEALSIKVMANLINNMNFDKVITLDNHSDVSTALINNCTNVPQENILNRNMLLSEALEDKLFTLVSPDAGAEKKILKVSQYFEGLDILYARKVRDTKTGKITDTKLIAPFIIGGKDFLIVDDICDGGMTFIKLAEEMNKFKPASISLYVTHGIFSKGTKVLYDAGIKEIYTTNSFPQTEESGVIVI